MWARASWSPIVRNPENVVPRPDSSGRSPTVARNMRFALSRASASIFAAASGLEGMPVRVALVAVLIAPGSPSPEAG